MNVAMYANTLTPTTKVKDSDGQFVVIGKQYACMFNAQWVQLLRYCMAAAVATTFSEPCIACPPNFLGLSKISLDIFPQRAGLSPLLSIHSACRECAPCINSRDTARRRDLRASCTGCNPVGLCSSYWLYFWYVGIVWQNPSHHTKFILSASFFYCPYLFWLVLL